MRVHYATEYEGMGNSYGYSVHNARVKQALAAQGAEFSEDARIAFHVASASVFKPAADKINVLYTAWESDSLTDEAAESYARADLILVTAPFLVNVFKQALPDKEVLCVHLGVDTDQYRYVRRHYDQRKPFRYLWVGAPNARKGFEVILQAWKLFENNPAAELYLKTTVTGKYAIHGNVIFDSRRLPEQVLASLYQSCHAFVFPSFGEGFGLTLFEALACGCPAIWTDCTAMKDYLGANYGYPLQGKPVPSAVGNLCQCDAGELAAKMAQVREDYANNRALRKAARAAKLVRQEFTWDNTARKIIGVLGEEMRTVALEDNKW
jgi:glycosyltransferase involved in cell wall biosynthesis